METFTVTEGFDTSYIPKSSGLPNNNNKNFPPLITGYIPSSTNIKPISLTAGTELTCKLLENGNYECSTNSGETSTDRIIILKADFGKIIKKVQTGGKRRKTRKQVKGRKTRKQVKRPKQRK